MIQIRERSISWHPPCLVASIIIRPLDRLLSTPGTWRHRTYPNRRSRTVCGSPRRQESGIGRLAQHRDAAPGLGVSLWYTLPMRKALKAFGILTLVSLIGISVALAVLGLALIIIDG